jgi:hypothetical protein
VSNRVRIDLRWLASLALLVLTGCWYGGDFYTAADVRPGLPAGRYTVVPLADRSDEMGAAIVTQRPDGFTEILPVNRDGREDRGDTATFGLVPIDEDGRLHAAWIVAPDEAARSGAEGVRPYGLLRHNADGSFDLMTITCAGPAQAAARQAGAQMPDGSRPYCRFQSRQSLEAALRAIAPSLDDGFRFRPAPAP